MKTVYKFTGQFLGDSPLSGPIWIEVAKDGSHFNKLFVAFDPISVIRDSRLKCDKEALHSNFGTYHRIKVMSETRYVSVNEGLRDINRYIRSNRADGSLESSILEGKDVLCRLEVLYDSANMDIPWLHESCELR